MPVLDAVEHLVGLQAQTPQSWYVSLWSRLHALDPVAVGSLLQTRRLVRIALMRSTIHLVTAADALRLRPILRPVLERGLAGNFGKHLVGMDDEALLAAGREILEARPALFSSLGRSLAERFPGRDPTSLAMAIRCRVPLVQATPRGVWGRSGQALHTTLASWLPGADEPPLTADDLVLRFLAAFGPATVKDAQSWCGLTRLNEVFDRLAPRLVRLRYEDGHDLFDLPDAPRPGPDVPAPVRFLPDFDNLLLSHADRSRFHGPVDVGGLWSEHGPVPGALLVDGFVRGGWYLRRQRAAAVLDVRTVEPLSATDHATVSDEGARLLEFLAAGSTDREVTITRTG